MFPDVQMVFLCSSLWLLPVVLRLCTTENLALSLLQPSFRYLQRVMRCPLSLPLSAIKSPSYFFLPHELTLQFQWISERTKVVLAESYKKYSCNVENKTTIINKMKKKKCCAILEVSQRILWQSRSFHEHSCWGCIWRINKNNKNSNPSILITDGELQHWNQSAFGQNISLTSEYIRVLNYAGFWCLEKK